VNDRQDAATVAAQHERARQQFGAVAEKYATSAVHAEGLSLQLMVEMARPKPADRVLDVGTGAGHTAFAFAPHVASVVASDITEEMLDQVRRGVAQRGLANVTAFGPAPAENLPFPDVSFELVLSRTAAHHFADPQAFVRSAFRVTAPGGALAFCDTISPDDDPATDAWLDEIERVRDPSHVRDWSTREWREMAEAAGYAVEAEDPSSDRAWLTLDDWTGRMNVPPHRYARLRELFATASDAARSWIVLEPRPAPQVYAFGLPKLIAVYRKPRG
jgi:ubiquinone/menaquinone biosynthesis C-methylase UbiE